MPRVYTLTGKGRRYVRSVLGMPSRKRFKLSEEQDKGHNPYFVQHTVAVTDVLIAARRLSQTHPGIILTRLITERELKRKIYVPLSETRNVCIEPNASCEFLIQQMWQSFVHIEVYRTLPPAEWGFKQKIQGYVTYVTTGQHEALFATPAISIAVFAQTPQMATTLKRWTQETLQEMRQPEEAEIFFFCSLNSTTANPEEVFLSPIWQQAFNDATTPLLVLE